MAFVGSDGRLLRQDVYSVLFVFLFTKLLANSPGTTGQSVMSSSVPPPLGGSWVVVISGLISPLIWVITIKLCFLLTCLRP